MSDELTAWRSARTDSVDPAVLDAGTTGEMETWRSELTDPVDRMLDAAAAAPTLARIRRDRDRAGRLVKPLEYLESHLFDPNLNADQLMRACGVGRPSTASKGFRETTSVSLTPYAYIEDCRLEVASWLLLLRPDLTMDRIATFLGYSTGSVFGDAFERWSGIRPTVYRAGVDRSVGTGGT